jgi:predicted secreted hydrolase
LRNRLSRIAAVVQRPQRMISAITYIRRFRVCVGLVMLCTAAFPSFAAESVWRAALPGWQYEFPRDHRPHSEFKTEWWYFTGNLRDAQGRRFGYQLTFFRQGVRPPAQRGATTSRFVIDDLKFAHFALTDVGAKKFRYEQRLKRGAFGETGFDAADAKGADRLAWIDDWQLTLLPDDGLAIRAARADARIEFTLEKAKAWVIHGENGVSQKAEGEGRASHYYSGTRLKTRGMVTVAGRTSEVSGESWFDHEWASNQLAPGQVGWDWFSLQFEDGTELMLYQMRLRDGGADPYSSGTFVAADGATRHLRRDDYQLKPAGYWTSRETGGNYPIEWRVSVPSLGLELNVRTPVREQELVLKPIAYWEGVIDVEGMRAGAKVRGHGYLELTGYAGELVGLSSER